jgi:hypothetical protein
MGRGGWGQRGEMAQTTYTYMNKCINNLKRKKTTEHRKIFHAHGLVEPIL